MTLRESEFDHFAVRYENLNKTFRRGDREICVLKDACGEIQPGEFVAIRGRSGSGKSTLLNLTAGIDEPTSGNVYIQGRSLATLNRRQRAQIRREQIGLVFQFFNLIPTLKVLENVTLPAELAGKGAREANQRARQLLARMGMQDREDDFPDRLSGGEQQRVAIARALIMRPAIVLADEPSGNLDPKTGEEVMSLLQELQDEQGSSLLMVTHSHQLAERADRILTIRDGLLIEESQA
jgi:putative ABC transport system ATP-binding protein